jgi:hypothetical protein
MRVGCRITPFVFCLLLLAAAPPGTLADDDIKAKIAAAGDAAKYNADAVVVLDETDVRVRPSGIGTARTHVVTKVLRDGAIRPLAVQTFEFDPHTNRLELLAVRVYRKEGAVEEVPLATKVQQPQPASGVFWGTQQYLVSVPRLNVGDAVETLCEMTGFNVAYLADAAGETPTPPNDEQLNAYGEVLQPPVAGNWHDEVHFWSNHPIIEKRYRVRVPKDKPLQHEIYNGELRVGALLEGDEVVYTFEKKDIAPFKDEPAMEPRENVATKLLLATLPSWEDKSRWLYSVSEPQFQADDAIRAQVAEVIRDCKTDEDKYTALNHWVAENIRYAGTSRGMCEGYTIHDIKETFHDRAGVCKDKAGMLVGMLRVAGFDSYLVMTMARQRVDRIPADQFNHAVSCIRKPDGTLMLLDPTWMPKSRDNWSMLEPLQHVVYGLPEGKELSQSPDFPPEMNQATWTGTSVIAEDGGLSGSFTFTGNGAPETRLRRALAGYTPADREHIFDEAAQRFGPAARLSDVQCMDPVDFSGPISLSAKIATTGFALGGDSQRYLRLPLLQAPLAERVLSDLLDKTALKERKYGLRLWATRQARFEETLTLPAGWEITKKPAPVDLDGPSAALHFKLDSSPGELHYTCELSIKRWIIPAAEYANFKEVMDKFTELTGRVLVCKKEGDRE